MKPLVLNGVIMESIMGISFSVKNIPEDVAERLRLRAERNHRSLQGELMAILETAAREEPAVPAPSSEQRGSRSVEETVQRLRTLFPVPAQGVSSSSLIRQMRDGRYGDAWAETGGQKGAA